MKVRLSSITEKKLSSGESANCFIKLNKAIVPYFDEPFIIRLGSPQVSIAGGKVLGIESTYPNRKLTEEIINLLGIHDYDNAIRKNCGNLPLRT